jgi:hypothetical protein
MNYHPAEAVVIWWVEEDEGRLSANSELERGAASTLAFVATDTWIVQEGFDLSISADYIGTIFLL